MNLFDIFGKGKNPWRFRIIIILMTGVLMVFIIKLFTIQVIQGADNTAQADENRISKISLPTQRGTITDRNGYVLARNVASYNVVITPADLPSDPGSQQEVFRKLSVLIDVPVSNGELTDETVKLFSPCKTTFGITEIVSIADSLAPYKPVRIKCNVDEKIAMTIEQNARDWPGAGVEIEPVRDYPTGQLTSEIIGFLGPVPAALEDVYTKLGFVPGRDKVGYAGIENSEQDILGGKNGERLVELDVAGKTIRDLEAPVDPAPGQNIELTIDTRLQAAAKAALKGEIDYWNTYLNRTLSTNGVVIAMNPKTGEILSLVSYPTFENNRMAREIPGDYYTQLINDPDRPLFNHAISAEHPPGSVFKIAAALGALNEKVVTPQQELMDPGKITIIQKFSENDPGTPRDYVNWNRNGFGLQNFVQAVANSNDVYFYKIGGGFKDEVPNGGLGIWRLAEYAKALGFGSPTGIELPGEASGLIPDPTWKRLVQTENWSTGDTYISTIGQGYVLSTVLQVLQAYATVANDGKMMQPTLIHKITNSNGDVIKDFTPVEKKDITKEKLIDVLDENNQPTGEKKSIEPWVINDFKEGLRMVVTSGTAVIEFEGMTVPSAGKTGTAEYCDDIARSKNLCNPGNWPAHAWFVGYAPYDDPEIIVVAFVYNGKEGSTVAAPIVRKVLEAYFELKDIDSGKAETPNQ
jgi:penicillin-binding protein 2